jgi:hypothetical protein
MQIYWEDLFNQTIRASPFLHAFDVLFPGNSPSTGIFRFYVASLAKCI